MSHQNGEVNITHLTEWFKLQPSLKHWQKARFTIKKSKKINPLIISYSSVVHLLVNLLVQLFLGVPLEMVHRWWRVVLVYLAGVAAGSLATSLTDPKVYLAGASGGVYALVAAHIATIIMVIYNIIYIFCKKRKFRIFTIYFRL